MKKKNSARVKKHRVYWVLAAAAVLAAIILIIIGVWVFGSGSEKKAASDDVSKVEETSNLELSVTADENWTEDSTPAIIHIKGKEGTTKELDFYHAVMPEGGKTTVGDTVEVISGKYDISTISPVNKDGSIYRANGTITVDAAPEDNVSVKITLNHIKVEDVTDQQLKEIIGQIQTAVENGDESLKGDAGRDILDKMNGNIENSPNASSETKQEAADVKEKTGTDTKPIRPTGSANNSSDKNSGSNGNTSSASGSENEGGSSSTGNPGASDSDSESGHQHNWQAHQVWVPNIVTVVDVPEQKVEGARLYTQQADGSWIANGETYWFENGFTVDDLKAIIIDKIRNEGYIGSYQNLNKTVPAVTHTEDQGSYQIDYYYCECGATKTN